ncbi:DUF4194 domain-containing protein [Alicyclobacillus sp. SO9]|uniref:DUF4194 domain-containing protein n=1 Tax=Alicyclobacillus sp. SO9 TaxID=2665646 RepID=UPI0018E7DB00|nr:DUF4194 domain-containing protein [Alicyclobacillus sp. SO9]QQE80527.1 DUF4194 domain-containing protein [Alicyclobacillus sp. SO9]
MSWDEQYRGLTERDKEAFSRLVSLLYQQTFLVRDVWDAKEHGMMGNRDYRFAERNLAMLKEYLAVGGFEIQVDGRRGVMAISNKYDRNRMRVDKFTTYLLYTLRLLYEEQMETASMRREVVVSLHDIIGKLYTIGVMDKRIALTQLQSTMNRLRQLSILDRVEGTTQDMESRWMIYPTITVAVSDDRINDLHKRMLSGELGGDVFDQTDLAGDAVEEEESQ